MKKIIIEDDNEIITIIDFENIAYDTKIRLFEETLRIAIDNKLNLRIEN